MITVLDLEKIFNIESIQFIKVPKVIKSSYSDPIDHIHVPRLRFKAGLKTVKVDLSNIENCIIVNFEFIPSGGVNLLFKSNTWRIIMYVILDTNVKTGICVRGNEVKVSDLLATSKRSKIFDELTQVEGVIDIGGHDLQCPYFTCVNFK